MSDIAILKRVDCLKRFCPAPTDEKTLQMRQSLLFTNYKNSRKDENMDWIIYGIDKYGKYRRFGVVTANSFDEAIKIGRDIYWMFEVTGAKPVC